jgi:hypothetical protein
MALRALARRQRLIHSHCCPARNFGFRRTLFFDAPLGGDKTMRWKISHHGHDPRQIDLLAILALLVVIAAAWHYFDGSSQPQSTTAFIVPSQSVRW